MEDVKKRVVQNLVIKFSEIPFEGLEIDSTDRFEDLIQDKKDLLVFADIIGSLKEPIHVQGEMFPVGSKVDVRANWKTTMTAECDRCLSPLRIPLSGSLDTFLMPESQFSAHDKPGGKVIHGPTGERDKSRHRSSTKVPELSDAEGEHEDVSFGAFDGKTVDLRGLLRESLMLEIPMRKVCPDACKATIKDDGEGDPEESPLASALKAKLKS